MPPASSQTAMPSVLVPTVPGTCDFNITIGCFYEDGSSCDTPVAPVQICTDRPHNMSMRFTGGDCSQSFNTQGNDFSCTDYQGGPSSDEGSQSWIEVASHNGEGAMYHDGWVTVGEVFALNDNDERFVSDIRISIYSSEDKSEDNLLQEVDFSATCTSNLALNDRFGASQVVDWYNLQQGTVSASVNVTFTVGLDIPVSSGEGITIDSVTVITDYGGDEQDLTLELAGTFLPAGSILPVTVPATIDVTLDTSFSFRIEIIGTDSDGNTCAGTGEYQFSTGPSTTAPTSSNGGTSPPIMPQIPTSSLSPGKSLSAHFYVGSPLCETVSQMLHRSLSSWSPCHDRSCSPSNFRSVRRRVQGQENSRWSAQYI